MRVTVFGASGKVGQLVVTELLSRNYLVTAFVHNNVPFESHSMLSITKGNIYNPQDVSKALIESEAVISVLGSWGTQRKDVVSTAAKHIVPAMQQNNIKRFVSLTGSDARSSLDSIGLVHRLSYPVLKLVAGKILHDGEEHIRILEKSKLEWTVLRSPAMNTIGSSKYKLTFDRPLPWSSVNRQSVALGIVNQLEDYSYLRQSPFISRG